MADTGGQTRTDPKMYQCEFQDCGKSFKRPDYLARHQLNHAPKLPHECHICFRGFARADVCQKHIFRHRPMEEREPEQPKPSSTRKRRKRVSSPSPAQEQGEHNRGSSLSHLLDESSHSPHLTTDFLLPPTTSHFAHGLLPRPFLQDSGCFQSFSPDVALSQDTSVLAHQEVPLEYSAEPLQESDRSMSDIFSWLFKSGSGGTTPAGFEGYVDPNQLSPTMDMSRSSATLMDLAHIAQDTGLRSHLPHQSTSRQADPVLHRSAGIYPSPLASTSYLPAASNRPPQTLGQANEIITEDARQAMLDLFAMDETVDLNVPSFTAEKLRFYLDLYFLHMNSIHPIVHRPTLADRITGRHALFLLALICIGTAFAEDKAGFQIALMLHSKMRHMIFEMVEQEPRVETHLLQAILLINYFGRHFSSPTSHDVAQVFHSPTIIMAKFAGLLRNDPQEKESFSPDFDGWLQWAKAEERRRLGWAYFLLDTQNSALFRHSLMVQCYDMKISLPCGDDLWNASTVADWSAALANRSTVVISFRSALRDLATKNIMRDDTSDFTALILLNGLLSVSWALLFRDLGDLSMVSENRIFGWKDSLAFAFTAWHGYNQKAITRRADMSFFWTTQPYAYFGTILLLTDTELVRTLAGAPRVAGRSIGEGERLVAHRQLQKWAESSDGEVSAWNALELLHQLFSWGTEEHFKRAPTTPWICYVTVLTLWAYSYLLEGKRDLSADCTSFASGTLRDFRIDSIMARKSAIDYTARMLSAGRPRNLSAMLDKNAIGGVIAYAACLIKPIDWGIMIGPHLTLIKLLGARPAE